MSEVGDPSVLLEFLRKERVVRVPPLETLSPLELRGAAAVVDSTGELEDVADAGDAAFVGGVEEVLAASLEGAEE